MLKIVPDSSEVEGNTNPTSEKQSSGAKYWCFTHNYELFVGNEKEIEYVKSWIVPYINKLKTISICFYISLEIGTDKNRLHLQGYIHLKNKIRLTGVKRIFDNTTHWEKCKGTYIDNFLYISKSPLYIWEHDEKKKVKVPVEILAEQDFYPFQKWILNYINGKVNKGHILWIYDPVGQKGKTSFLRHMNIKYGVPFSYGGKNCDIINLIWNNKEYLDSNTKPCFIYNLGRDTDNECISYQSMESISDGAIANNKFEAGCCVFNYPHVIVLANCLPKMDRLTANRWIIKTIDDNNDIVDVVKKKKIVDKVDEIEIIVKKVNRDPLFNI